MCPAQAGSGEGSGRQDARPYAEVTPIRPVVRDGWYNASTAPGRTCW